MSAKDFVLTFGKYEGETLAEVWETDMRYVEWLHENFEPGSKIWEAVNTFIEEET